MRRSLAAVLLGISLWLGALAWSGFLMTRTVLDPGRSEDVARALLDDDGVRDQLVENIAGGVQDELPAGARVDQAVLEAGAAEALDTPEVEALVLDALVQSHRELLGGDRAPDAIDGGDFGAAARRSLTESRPELEGLLPEAPSFEVPLPTDYIPDLGPLRRGLLTAVPILAAAAVAGIVVSLLVTTNRPRVLRRAGFWAIGLAAFVLVFAYGVPAIAQAVAPAQAQIVAALVAALAATTRWPALALAAAGAAAVVASVLWSALPQTGPTAAPHQPDPGRERAMRSPPRRSPRRDLPTPGRRQPHPRTDELPVAAVGTAVPAPTRPDGPPQHTSPRSPEPDVTRVEQAAATQDGPTTRQGPARDGARWVEGFGWVHDGTGEIPDTARWVPGVGYVLDE